MLTIDRLAKIDNLAQRTIGALYRAVERIGDKHETLIVNAAYKVAESKAAAIDKAEDKISDLEDARAELVAYGLEARTILQRKYREALEALTRELEAKDDKLNAELAAAEALVAANKAYEATVKAASDKLDVEVDA